MSPLSASLLLAFALCACTPRASPPPPEAPSSLPEAVRSEAPRESPAAANAVVEAAAAVEAPGEAPVEPRITVISPPAGYQYGARVLVSGKAEAPGGLERLTYSLRSPEVFAEAAQAMEGRAQLKADGSFSFVIVTRGLKGPQELSLQAKARNGSEGQATVALVPGEGDIPWFRVEPADGQLTLSWEPLPGAGPHTLFYRIENPAQPPSAQRQVNGVRSPYVLSGLQNGNLYALRLSSAIPGEPAAGSVTKTAIPLSPGTLDLKAQGEYRRIRLTWKKIPACASYEIWRATSADGVYAQIGGPVAEGSYLDEEVRYAQQYFYRIRLSGSPYAGSRAAWARMAGLPEQRVEARGSFSLAGIRGITVYGAYAFAAAGPQGLQIIDVADPKSPVVVGSCPTESANAVAVRGELAFVADGPRGLAAMDVSDPRNPKFLGARKTSDARAAHLKDQYAFVADGPGGLKVLDVSNPSQPSRVASLETAEAWDVTGRGSLLYLADGRGGFLAVDAADPLSPRALGRLPARDARAVTLCGELVLLADGEQGLMVIDVSRPAEPLCIGSCALPGAMDVDGGEQLAYVTVAGKGIAVVDLSDPRRPFATASLDNGKVQAVAAGEDCAYVVDERGLSTVLVLVQGRSYPVAFSGAASKAFRVLLNGEFAYLAGHAAGVSVVDVTSPAAVSAESVVAVCRTEYAAAVAVRDNRLYVADGRRGIKIFNLAAASGPAEEAVLYTGGNACGVALAGNLLFVSAGPEGVKVLDVSNPRKPAQIAEIPSRDARDVAAAGDQLLVADAEEGLLLFDVSAAAAPRRVASLPSLKGYRLALREGQVFVAGPAGLHMVELGQRFQARLLGSYETQHAEDVALAGPYAYLAEGHRGLTVLDVSRPGLLRPVSACPEVYAVGVAARGDYAFVADSKGLQIVRVLVPAWLRRGAADRP